MKIAIAIIVGVLFLSSIAMAEAGDVFIQDIGVVATVKYDWGTAKKLITLKKNNPDAFNAIASTWYKKAYAYNEKEYNEFLYRQVISFDIHNKEKAWNGKELSTKFKNSTQGINVINERNRLYLGFYFENWDKIKSTIESLEGI